MMLRSELCGGQCSPLFLSFCCQHQFCHLPIIWMAFMQYCKVHAWLTMSSRSKIICTRGTRKGYTLKWHKYLWFLHNSGTTFSEWSLHLSWRLICRSFYKSQLLPKWLSAIAGTSVQLWVSAKLPFVPACPANLWFQSFIIRRAGIWPSEWIPILTHQPNSSTVFCLIPAQLYPYILNPFLRQITSPHSAFLCRREVSLPCV